MTNLKISQIFIYPVKSLAGISVEEATVTPRGLEYDRRWLLIDEKGRFLSQREHPQMALLQTHLEENFLKITHKTKEVEPLYIPLSEDGYAGKALVKAQVWDDEIDSLLFNKEADDWFSTQLNIPCRLVYMPEKSKRKVDERYMISEDDITSFSDGYPVLLIGQSSLDDLNKRLSESVQINRFRPNLVYTGGQPYEEESWYNFSAGNTSFFGVKPCSRCIMVTVDPEKGERSGKDPLYTLSTYRKIHNKVLFGQNLIPADTGKIALGDSIEVKEIREWTGPRK